MANSEEDRLAKCVQDANVAFLAALSDERRRYPSEFFKTFENAIRAYIDAMKDNSLIHRSVASCVSGLREFLEVERKRVPGDVLARADRLECLLFSGYDPDFDGFEPPGL